MHILEYKYKSNLVNVFKNKNKAKNHTNILAYFNDPHISQIDKSLSKFCPKFFRLIQEYMGAVVKVKI